MSAKTGKNVVCKECSKEFYKSGEKLSRSENHFCSAICASEFRKKRIIVQCCVCKKEHERTPSGLKKAKKYIFCSNKCLKIGYKGKNFSGFFKKGNKEERCINYKNGEQIANGYVMILSHKHPNKNKRNYIYKHRAVMEKSIGRYLRPEEVVHHIDFDKKNNDISNLMLFSNDSEHHKYHNSL